MFRLSTYYWTSSMMSFGMNTARGRVSASLSVESFASMVHTQHSPSGVSRFPNWFQRSSLTVSTRIKQAVSRISKCTCRAFRLGGSYALSRSVRYLSVSRPSFPRFSPVFLDAPHLLGIHMIVGQRGVDVSEVEVVSIGEVRWTESAILDASLNESDRNPRFLDMRLVVDCGLVPGNDAIDLLPRHRTGVYAHRRIKACWSASKSDSS